MTNPQAWEGKPLQLHGYVVPGSILQAAGHARVQVQGAEQPDPRRDQGHVVDASYTGIVPDTFKDEAEVVLRGQLTSTTDSTSSRTASMAKCPSKYEAKPRQPERRTTMASLGTFLLLAAFVVCSYAAVVSVAGARRRSRRLIESGIGAFYLVCALMTRRLGRHDQRVPDRRLLDQVRRRTTRTASSRCSTRSPRTGAGSTARSCSGCSCCRCSARWRCT